MSSWAEKVAREGYEEWKTRHASWGWDWPELDRLTKSAFIAVAKAGIERGREPEPESGSPQDGRSPGIEGSAGGIGDG
jgi:hypothetical protein